ncbi:MAG: hypothetical protein V4590_06445 [Bacteroidota bacterium]
MKTERNVNPQDTPRTEDTKKTNPSVTTTGTGHLNQETTRTPGKEEDKEPWKNPDPTTPEKRQDIYAGKKDETIRNKEGYGDEEATDEDVDRGPDAKHTNRGREDNDIDKKENHTTE